MTLGGSVATLFFQWLLIVYNMPDTQLDVSLLRQNRATRFCESFPFE